MASFGLTNQVLTLYLKELQIRESLIGLFMSLTMIGDTLLSYFLVWNSNKIGNRRVMIIGGLLMLGSGIVFAWGTDNFALLLTASILGVISPSGNETGPFKSIEEAVLATLTPTDHRPEVFAIHAVLAAAGASLGELGAGFFVQTMVSKFNWSFVEAYRNTFIIYCAIAVLKLVLMFFLSKKCEISNATLEDGASGTEASESTPLLVSTVEYQTVTGLAPETQRTLFKLLVTFTIDSFGAGFMPVAWIIYYFRYQFDASPATLGTIFSSLDILQAFAAFPSAWFAKHVGPIKSSIFTQIPCGLALLCIPLLGRTLPLATVFLLFNQTFTAFDVIPRQILLTSVTSPEELPKVMGTVNIAKTAVRAISPNFTGILAQKGQLWVCFVLNAVNLIVANLILGYNFPHLDSQLVKS
ncbi:hypothetical protein OGAPHI_004401 [Ogataea philodendri]|uniref:Major facilitator superfamily (MFS) profile domain-containing protein n=1 Tax=Ogataea philodendri TaxID=1378263 RepID=A0A9P8P6L1_9ASCO|nr:uncharacterized protein OGAPHI_004401 [Ogataea philodendri]KAH3666212.1 hypothetical protein OGAPHI_004401 [Ogataea philodendri]